MCIYDVAERIMLRRFQVRSVDMQAPGITYGFVVYWGVCRREVEPSPNLFQSDPASSSSISSLALLFLQVTSNRSLDGVLDTLNSRNMTDAGPLQLIDHEDKVC